MIMKSILFKFYSFSLIILLLVSNFGFAQFLHGLHRLAPPMLVLAATQPGPFPWLPGEEGMARETRALPGRWQRCPGGREGR